MDIVQDKQYNSDKKEHNLEPLDLNKHSLNYVPSVTLTLAGMDRLSKDSDKTPVNEPVDAVLMPPNFNQGSKV